MSVARPGGIYTSEASDNGGNSLWFVHRVKLRAPARAEVISGVCHLIDSPDGIHGEVVLCVHNDDVQAPAVGCIYELVNRIEPADVEGVEGAARLAGRIMLRNRDDVEHAVRPIHGSSTGRAIGLRAATVQEKSERQNSSYFENLQGSGPHRKTSSGNSPRIFRAVALLSFL